MTPLISVVIPSYNHARFLSRALDSLQQQTYNNWEAIIVDNHSQDDTDYIVKQFQDPRISLLKIQNNGIIAASRNKGIRAAKGEYIAFLDSDDAWTPDKLQECIAAMECGADLVYHDLKVIREKPSRFEPGILRTRRLSSPVLFDLLVNDNAINNSSVVVRTDLLKQIGGLDENPKMAGAEDYNGWLRIAALTERFFYIPKVLGYYQVHAKGVSQKDMSECYRTAVDPFMSQLTQRQQTKIRGTLAYMKAKYHYLNDRHIPALDETKAARRLGSVSVKMKSIALECLIRVHKILGNNKAIG